MATLNDRIKKIQQYFKGFNIANETTFVLVSFPKHWQTFDETILNETYNVYTGKKDEGVYFITETINGTDCLFDAIEYVIDTNKSIEEKQELLQIKAKELTDLFISEPLEKLKTLQFTFVSPKRQRKVKNEKNKVVTNFDSSKDITPLNNLKEEIEKCPIEQEQPLNEKKEEKVTKKSGRPKKKVEDSETMSFLKDLTGEK